MERRITSPWPGYDPTWGFGEERGLSPSLLTGELATAREVGVVVVVLTFVVQSFWMSPGVDVVDVAAIWTTDGTSSALSARACAGISVVRANLRGLPSPISSPVFLLGAFAAMMTTKTGDGGVDCLEYIVSVQAGRILVDRCLPCA